MRQMLKNVAGRVAGMLVVAVLAGCCTCGGGSATGPKFSVFANGMDRVAKQRGVTLERAAEMLAAEGVTGFDWGYSDKNLERYAQTVLKPVNLYGFISFNGPDRGEKECEAFVATAVRYGVPRIMCIPNAFPDGVESEADTLEAIVTETLGAVSSERTSRVIDKDSGAGSMEKRKREGYF